MRASGKTAQFLHENGTWKRLLDFIIQENSYLKTRLSEVVDTLTDKSYIASAEQFQNEFISKDDNIHDIAHDLILQEKQLQLTSTYQMEPDIKIAKQQDKLRNEMAAVEKEFFKLKEAFNKYLLSIVP